MQLLAITLDAHKGSASHNPRCSLGPPPPSAKTIVRRCGGSQMSCDASCIRFENASLLVGVEIYQPTNLSPHTGVGMSQIATRSCYLKGVRIQKGCS